MSKIRKRQIFKAMKFRILKSAKFYSSEIKQVYSSAFGNRNKGYYTDSVVFIAEIAKIVRSTDRTGIKRSDAHDDRVRPIVRIRLIHCTQSFHFFTLP